MGENVSMKVYQISKYLVWNSYLSIKANGGSAGIDDINLKDYEANVKQNLYKLWNRMSSGSYFPKPVKLVEILKSNGGVRPLGIPTVEDRIAQMVVVKTIEDRLESIFHKDSYGYRHGKSAHNAVKTAKLRCWEYSWVLDMDISKFFDTIDHNLLMRAVEKHVTEKWILLYIKRWLSVPYQLKDGQLVERTMGVPQGSEIYSCIIHSTNGWRLTFQKFRLRGMQMIQSVIVYQRSRLNICSIKSKTDLSNAILS